MALNANALITEAEYELFLGNLSLATADAEAQINYASDYIERYTNRVLIQTAYTRQQYDGNDRQFLLLDNLPITNGETFTVEEWDTFNDSLLTTLVVNQDYLVYEPEGKIYNRGLWFQGKKRWRITYTAGWLIANVPDDLKVACAKIANLLRVNSGGLLKASENIGNYAYQNIASGSNLGFPIPLEIIVVLKAYRRDIL